jgi:hypothetical protein
VDVKRREQRGEPGAEQQAAADDRPGAALPARPPITRPTRVAWLLLCVSVTVVGRSIKNGPPPNDESSGSANDK